MRGLGPPVWGLRHPRDMIEVAVTMIAYAALLRTTHPSNDESSAKIIPLAPRRG
jgi:hypothetical protein